MGVRSRRAPYLATSKHAYYAEAYTAFFACTMTTSSSPVATLCGTLCTPCGDAAMYAMLTRRAASPVCLQFLGA